MRFVGRVCVAVELPTLFLRTFQLLLDTLDGG